MQRFGATLRQYRQQQHLSHKALAARIGIRSSYISEIELGKRNITVLTLLRLARALDIPLAWLLIELDMHAHVLPSATSDPPPSTGGEGTLLHVVGATIRHYRQQRQLTQAALAAMTDVSTSHICQIEQGNRSVSLLNLVRIAAAFGLSVSALLPPLEPAPGARCPPIVGPR